MLGPLCKGKRLPQHHVAANTHRKTGSGRRGCSYGNGLQAASEHTSISLQKPEGTARPLPMALDFLPPLWLLLLSPLCWVPSHSQRLEALGLPLPFLLWLSALLGILACSVDLFMLYMGRRAPQFHPQL